MAHYSMKRTAGERMSYGKQYLMGEKVIFQENQI